MKSGIPYRFKPSHWIGIHFLTVEWFFSLGIKFSSAIPFSPCHVILFIWYFSMSSCARTSCKRVVCLLCTVSYFWRHHAARSSLISNDMYVYYVDGKSNTKDNIVVVERHCYGFVVVVVAICATDVIVAHPKLHTGKYFG